MTQSAGILLYRRVPGGIEILVAHPGGPYWARKDDGSWSIPKGEIGRGEEPAAAALREFEEETGQPIAGGDLLHLGTVVQRGGKVVRAFAVEGDFDPDSLAGDTVEIRWPPGSGRRMAIPEIDRVAWVTPQVAAVKLNPAQVAFVERLVDALHGSVDHAE